MNRKERKRRQRRAQRKLGRGPGTVGEQIQRQRRLMRRDQYRRTAGKDNAH